MRDKDDISRLLGPDVIILDEAQRIKNWRTKTAAAIKTLYSPYAFVLTGTPIENRIDDIYSIIQFLDPRFFGSLFRLNRDFYQLDERGKPTGYKNLDVLHKKLQPLLLRRRKTDVEEELPERTVNNYFVEMTKEQQQRYYEPQEKVAKLAAIAKKRPLLPQEFERLQLNLAKMRMLCDTPYIMDEACKIFPKLDELGSVFDELLEDKTNKIIIFSEWERMLMLVREELQQRQVGFAWHTGSVNQKQRPVEIKRFKNDAECRVFLSTDAGSVGLNLQAANIVINLDLPWNPAKLEQRIARAWRKHQKRSVQVINFVSEHTIEHRMLGLPKQKQMLADNVLELGDAANMDMPSSRASFMEQLDEVLGVVHEQPVVPAEQAEVSKLQLAGDEIIARFAPRLERLQAYCNENGECEKILAVLEGDVTMLAQQTTQIINQTGLGSAVQVEIMDKATYETLQRLAKMGVISFNNNNITQIFQSQPEAVDSAREKHNARIKAAQDIIGQAQRSQRMAKLLYDGEFYAEALAPICNVFAKLVLSFAVFNDVVANDEAEIEIGVIDKELVRKFGLPSSAVALASQLQDGGKLSGKQQIGDVVAEVAKLLEFVEEFVNKGALACAA